MPTLSFGSYAELEKTLSGPGVDASIAAIMYDNERWPLTPESEQRDPAHFERLAATAVHEHHLQFLSAPAQDLVGVLGKRPDESNDAAYVRLGLAGQAAASGADLVSIQAQRLENDSSSFTSFVSAAARQARSQSPRVMVFAGLSTNPSGQAADPARLAQDTRDTRDLVDGIWLNVPGQSKACPDCGIPRGDIGAKFLRLLAMP